MVDIVRHIDRIGACGQTLSVAERSALQVAMLQRRDEEGLPSSLLFWGKVLGDKDDYLICNATIPPGSAKDEDDDGFPRKKYFYCRASDTSTLVQMPPLPPDFAAKAAAASGRFVGEPSFPLDAEADDAAADPAPEEEDPSAPAPRERAREEHRLAHVVALIDKEVSLVPQGAWVVDASRRVRPRRPFDGLSAETAASLRGYRHFRPPQTAAAAAALAKKGLVRGDDFLDPLEADKPLGVWSVALDPQGATAWVGSRLWPGYHFFHEVGTAEYGGVYFGNGLRNDDLAFML